MDDLHIFPFCRQSYEAGLNAVDAGRRSWNAALEVALDIIDKVEALPSGRERHISTVRDKIRARMLDESEAA